MTVLAVLTVLESTLPPSCLSYKTRCQGTTVTVLTVSAVVAVPVVTATPLKLNPPLRQDFYQTYARINGNQGLAQIFWGLLRLKHRKISRKPPERAPFFLRESRVARNPGDSPF